MTPARKRTVKKKNNNNKKKNKRSKFAGVTKEGKLYRASIIIDGKKVLLDTYPRAMFAALAHDRAAHEQGRPSTSWNYPAGYASSEDDEGNCTGHWF